MCNLYLMYYTDMDKGDDFFECVDEELRLPPLPASSLLPPPKNAALENLAMGKMGHSGHALAVGNSSHLPFSQYILMKLFFIL